MSQPVNDNADKAIVLQVGVGCGTLYTNVGATQAVNEPMALCSDYPAGFTNQHIVWFKFIPPSSGAVRISTDFGLGSLNDAQAALFSATDSSDYSTFQIISCDDDNGSIDGVASVLYATGLECQRYYYVLVDGWPSAVGTFCLRIDELDSTMISKTSDCNVNSYQPPWGSNINQFYKGWVPLVDEESKLVALVRDTSGSPANAFRCAETIHQGATRLLPNGTPYLDRNLLIRNSSAATNLDIQYFFTESEFMKLKSAAGGNLSKFNLHVLKQDTTCQTNYAAGKTATSLPHQCNDLGSSKGANWITVTTPAFTNYCNFYIVPGTGLDTTYSYYEVDPPCFDPNPITLVPTDTSGLNSLQSKCSTELNYTWWDGSHQKIKQVDKDGIYWVYYKVDSGGCDFNVDIFEVVYPVFSATTGGKGCKGESNGLAWITFSESDTVIYGLEWYDASGNQVRRTAGRNDTLKGILFGTYFVHVTTPEGCDTILSVDLGDESIELIAGSDSTLNYPGSIQLWAKGADIYLWDPALWLDNPFLAEPVCRPQSSIIYKVYGSSYFGCRDTSEVKVDISPRYYLPTAFSPNGDGLNDYLVPRIYWGSLVSFQIFNRWGQQVYSAYGNHALQGWDGRFKGEPADIGTYFYSIEIKLYDGRSYSKKGDITLVR